MFCPECGVKNPDNAVFCEECGTKIASSTPVKASQTNELPQMSQPQSAPVQPAKPLSKIKRFILVELVLLCLIVAFTYNYGKKSFGPEKTAERHFLNVMNGDWEGVYNEFDIVESEFIDKSNFLKTKKSVGGTLINTYKIDEVDYDRSSLGATVYISYRLKGNTENVEYKVVMNKQADKTFGLFDSWKVDPSSYICNDYMIIVPEGAKVNFQGKELSSSYLEEDDYGEDDYRIPQLFHGKYDIMVTKNYMEDVETIASTNSGGYYLGAMNMKEEVIKEVLQKTEKSFEEYYKAVFNRDSFDKIASMFSEDSDIREDMERNYSNLVYELALDDELGLEKIDFHNVTGTAYYQPYDAKDCIYVTLYYDYTATSTSYGWWTRDIEINTYSGDNYAEFTYVLENDQWVLDSTNINSIYY